MIKMSTKLFVGGLSWGTTDDKLRDHFAQIGNVVSAMVIIDKYTGKSKGFGFVEFATEEEAKSAIDKLNNTAFDGRTITVNEAKPMVPRSNDGGSFHKRNDRGRGDRGRY